ncbi:MAG: tellurite resistance/C4-dicarboxylate transporter family protein [Beijerinckiaceae bacterium]|nr:tellurite resistance/C4-dicarboxylate transporter family protein [Beijerinckiaceae bacterium]
MPRFNNQTKSALPFLNRLGAWITGLSAALHPGSFALVMATGIISNALFLEGYQKLSGLLLYVNTLAYAWLAILLTLRALKFPQAIWSDLTDPRAVFSFFTLIAANGVFGAGLHLRGAEAEALGLWLLSLAMWLLLIYLGFAVMTFRSTAIRADAAHGGWLLAIVGSESLVILGALIAPSAGASGPSVFVLIHMLWGVGIGLYAVLVTIIAFRIFFLATVPDDLTPMLWVVMGAAAISTNAGSTLLLKDSGLPPLTFTRPFIEGVTLILWAWAAWWIPLLLLFGVWKHAVCRAPLTYTPLLWGIVFPLGMFALASLRLSLAAHFSPLRTISLAMLWISVAAWAATFAALLAVAWRGFRNCGEM